MTLRRSLVCRVAGPRLEPRFHFGGNPVELSIPAAADVAAILPADGRMRKRAVQRIGHFSWYRLIVGAR
jgi:hypothetical protein